jgi:hypothetical protein
VSFQQFVRRFFGFQFAFQTAAAMAVVCLAQGLAPGAPDNAGGRASSSAIPPSQPPGPDPGSAMPPGQPLGPGLPLVEPGNGPPLGISQQPSVMVEPGPAVQRSDDLGMSGDMAGSGGRGGMEGPGSGIFPSDSFRYGALWLPTVPVHGQPANYQMEGEDLFFGHPMWKDSLDAVGLFGSVRNRHTQTDAILPDTGQPSPSELWGVNLGLRYNRQLNDGWMTGGGVSIGSASDHPFASIREMNVGMNATLRIPQGEHNAWLFTLMHSPVGELNSPAPGVAFGYNPSPQFHANIGLPLMVMWRPTEDWQFQASYMLIRTIHFKAQCRLAQQLSAFAAYDWSNESYILLDRPDPNDRYFIYDQRLSMGIQSSLLEHWTASNSAGFIFDRYIFEGTTSVSNGSNRVGLGNEPFAALNLGSRF